MTSLSCDKLNDALDRADRHAPHLRLLMSRHPNVRDALAAGDLEGALAFHKAPLDPEDLAEHVQLVLTDPLESTGPNFNVVSPTVWRFVDIGRRLDFLLGGFGWGFMPHYLVREHIAAGRLFKLRLSDANIVLGAIDVSVIHDRSRTPGRAAQWLLTKMREPNWHETFAGGLPASSDEKLGHSVQQNT